MSGPICPDCNLIAFEKIFQNHLKCKICGWIGKDLPRKITSSKMQKNKILKTNKLLKLRESGDLFYFRIYLVGSEEDKSSAISEIMEILEINTISGWDMLFFYLTVDPGIIKMERIKQITSVKKIEIY